MGSTDHVSPNSLTDLDLNLSISSSGHGVENEGTEDGGDLNSASNGKEKAINENGFENEGTEDGGDSNSISNGKEESINENGFENEGTEDGGDLNSASNCKENLEEPEKVVGLGNSVAYIHSKKLIEASDALPVHRRSADGKGRNRNAMVHSLIKATGLLKTVQIIEPSPATAKDALLYHDKGYLNALLNLNKYENDTEALEEFGICQDAAAFKHVAEHALFVLGGTLSACHELTSGNANIAINWCGGRHHALRAEASGFCYINDVVLAILRLQEKFAKVLCVDIDVHHGDGQESAFYYTDSVMTVSYHLYEPGFFPGKTGDADDIGCHRGEGFNLNVPLSRGICGKDYFEIFTETLGETLRSFVPDAVVLVCGADGLKSDPRGGLKLESKTIVDCTKFIKKLDKPLLVLGAGGYNFSQTSKCWTAVTATLLNAELPEDIPEHKYFEYYGPSWKL